MAGSSPEPTTERCVHWRTYTELLSSAPKLRGSDLRVVPSGEWPTWPEDEIAACPDPCHQAPLAIADAVMVGPLVASVQSCGTPGGWMRHRRSGEDMCAVCREAKNAYARAWRARKRADALARERLVWSEVALPGLDRV